MGKLIVYAEKDRGGKIVPFEIKIGSLYYVQNKIDLNAPDGFIKEQTSRLPTVSEGAKIINLAVADPQKSTMNNTSLTGKFYDTCLTRHSNILKSALANLTEEQYSEQLELVKQYIIEPVEDILGKDVLDPKNYEFWGERNAWSQVFSGKIYNTKDPIQLMHLYLLTLNGQLAPKPFEKRPKFIDAEFCIDNQDDKRDSNTKSLLSRNKAIANFVMKVSDKPLDASYLLEYLGHSNVAGFESEEELSIMFETWLVKEPQNADIFNKAYEELFADKSKKDLFEIFKMVVDSIKNHKFQYHQGSYYLDEIEIGSGPRSMTRKIFEDKDLKKLLLLAVKGD